MAYKIVIDAGHGGADPGAVYGRRQEKDDNLTLALEVGRILADNGVDVIYTRTTDLYQTPFEKAQIANEANADYFISIHRNSSPEPGQYQGVETLLYDKSGVKLEMAEAIDGALEDLGFRNLGVKARPGLVVLRRTRMPALLIEVGFLNTDSDNALFDERQEEIAQAIANAILGTLDLETVESAAIPSGEPEPHAVSALPAIAEDAADETYYRVQVGLFKIRQNADRLLYELLDQGYPAFILYDDDYYKVQVGAYRILGNAIIMERRLRREGYSTLITT